MKNSLLHGALGTWMIGSLSAAVTFEAPTYNYTPPPPDLNDGNPNAIIPSIGPAQDGWSQSEATFSDAGNDYPLFYVEEAAGGDRLGAIGGMYGIPDSPPFSAQRDFASFLTVGQTTFRFDAAVFDSVDFPSRNNFGFTLSDGTTELVTIDLRPFSQVNTVTTWEIFVGIGGAAPATLNGALVPGNFYDFVVEMNGTGIQVDITGGVGATGSTSGTFPGYDPSSTNDLTAEFTWAQGSGADFGDNRILLNNIEAIPEPASFLLLGLGGLGLLRRRRR